MQACLSVGLTALEPPWCSQPVRGEESCMLYPHSQLWNLNCEHHRFNHLYLWASLDLSWDKLGAPSILWTQPPPDSPCFCCSVAQVCLTLCNPMDRSTPGFPVLHHLLEFAPKCVHWVDDTIQPSYSAAHFPPDLNLPQYQVFSNELALHIRWPKFGSFSISSSIEYSGPISFRMDWLDLPALQGTLKTLLQHHSSKASILRCSAFFMVQLSHVFMTTR